MKSSIFIDPHQKCPNCYSDEYIRSVKPVPLDTLFWSDYEPVTIVKCLQCDETIHTFQQEKKIK